MKNKKRPPNKRTPPIKGFDDEFNPLVYALATLTCEVRRIADILESHTNLCVPSDNPNEDYDYFMQPHEHEPATRYRPRDEE